MTIGMILGDKFVTFEIRGGCQSRRDEGLALLVEAKENACKDEV